MTFAWRGPLPGYAVPALEGLWSTGPGPGEPKPARASRGRAASFTGSGPPVGIPRPFAPILPAVQTARLPRLAAKAAALRRLHQPGRPVLFANIWDPVSARWLEQAGWPAVATSSAAIANAHGYPDGERIPLAEMLAAVARIAGAVEVPVSADMEAGYGATPEAWAATAAALLAAGAVGCNLEDAAAPAPGGSPLVAVELQCALLRAVRQTADQAGVPLVINARCDAYLLHAPPAGWDAWAETVPRVAAYRAAGADCIFVPGLTEVAIIRRLIATSPGPLNVLAGPGAPAVAELAAAGVARISLGSGPHRAALGWFGRVAEELRGPGTYTAIAEVAPSYTAANALLEPPR